MNFLKKFSILFLFIFFVSFFCLNYVQAFTLNEDAKEKISNRLNSLVEYVQNGETDKLLNLIDPEKENLKNEIKEQLSFNKTDYQLDFLPLDKNLEVIGSNQARVKSGVTLKKFGWEISGSSAFFELEKINGEWLITDTDFHQKTGLGYIWNILKKYLIVLIPVLLIIFAFWLWMLIDVIKRDLDGKIWWILLIIFLDIFGAIIYFFAVKRIEDKKSIAEKRMEKLENWLKKNINYSEERLRQTSKKGGATDEEFEKAYKKVKFLKKEK